MQLVGLQKWYPVSKTKAEKAAWEFADKHGLDMVTVHPSTCLGTLLQPGLNASCAVLKQLLQGSKETQEYHWLGAVHVKDVAEAQVLLYESPAAHGRYLCTNGIYQFRDFAQRVSQLFPEFPVHRYLLSLHTLIFWPVPVVVGQVLSVRVFKSYVHQWIDNAFDDFGCVQV